MAGGKQFVRSPSPDPGGINQPEIGNNMKKAWILAAGWVLLAGSCPAQLMPLPATVAKSFLKNSDQILLSKSFDSSVAYQAHLRSLERENFRGLDRMIRDYFLLDAQKVSPTVLRQDEQLRRILVRDWLERDFYAARYMQALRKNILVQAVQGKQDYTRYIPSGTRLVIMGEIHQQNWMVNEVERVILQLKARYPDKNIYYASEFVDASDSEQLYILQHEYDVERLVRKRPYYRAVTSRLMKAGVRVVGLEDPVLSEEFIRVGGSSFSRQSAFAWKAVSSVAVKKRNLYWARIIRRIYEQDPRALVVVHAGMGHTNYNQSIALPWLLKEYKPFVTEFSERNIQFNTLLNGHVPFSEEVYSQARNLLRKDPIRPVYLVRHLKSKRAAVSLGCDLSIYRVDPKELYE